MELKAELAAWPISNLLNKVGIGTVIDLAGLCILRCVYKSVSNK